MYDKVISCLKMIILVYFGQYRSHNIIICNCHTSVTLMIDFCDSLIYGYCQFFSV